jgi:hypothetical protein
MDEESPLEFTDKRVRDTLGEAGQPPAAAAPAPAAADETPTETAEDEPLAAMDVYALLTTTISLLSSGAWAWMGLTASPFTGKMEKDMPQAKTAIDTVAFLVDQVEPRLSETDRRDLRNMLSNLRLNYVQQMQAPAAKEETA